MSSEIFPPVPTETARAARSVFGRSNFYLATGDQVNSLFSGIILEDPHGRIHKPSRSQAMLYLITIFQYVETLPDNSAADALRLRTDWKYALHLPLTYPGLSASSFCEFRKWLLSDRTGEQTLQTILTRLSEVMLVTGKPCFSLPSGDIVRKVCLLSRLAMVWDSIGEILGVLAGKQPEWLRTVNLPHWYERYGNHQKTINLVARDSELEALAQQIGADGDYLLKAISDAHDLALANLPEILGMKQIWKDQYVLGEGKISWRKDACAYCSSPIHEKGFNEKINRTGTERRSA